MYAAFSGISPQRTLALGAMADTPPRSPAMNPQDPDAAAPVPPLPAAAVASPSVEQKRAVEAVVVKAAMAAAKADTAALPQPSGTLEAKADMADADGAMVCDACEYCDDLCRWAACKACNEKEERIKARPAPRPGCGRFTTCQLRRHCTKSDVWLAAHGVVYDATEILEEHPGGVRSILRHAGQDCTEDFDFHSKAARGLWKDLKIGTLVHCPKDGGDSRCAIM